MYTIFSQSGYWKFNADNWQWEANPFTKLDFGKWELVIPANGDGSCAIKHLSEVKVIIRNQSGQLVPRLSPWAKYVVQPPKELNQGTNYKQIVWNPPANEVSSFFFGEVFIKEIGKDLFEFCLLSKFRFIIQSTKDQPSRNR